MAQREPYADPNEVAKFAETLSERFLQCRDWGHSWRGRAVAWDEQARAWDRTLRCTRCTTERRQVLSRSGEILPGGSYVYPDGYQHKGLGRIVGDGRDALRAESIRRITEG